MVAVTRAAALLVAAATAAGCGGSPTQASVSTGAALSGSVVDAAGDASITPVLRGGLLITPVVAVLPDLTAATVNVTGANLTATITFAPGTMSQSDTSACLMLDVDENAGTGAVSSDPSLGYDYSICAVNPRRSSLAQISRLGGGTAVGVGSVAATFPAANQVSFTAPLTLLGNDDGRMAFKVMVIQFVDDPVVFNTNPIDWMPDIGRAGGLIR